MACGTPVVATAVGGTPEQVKSLQVAGATDEFPKTGASAATGVLVAAADAEGMARAVAALLGQKDLLCQMAVNAARDARERFDLDRQCDAYLDWYQQIVDRQATARENANSERCHRG